MSVKTDFIHNSGLMFLYSIITLQIW